MLLDVGRHLVDDADITKALQMCMKGRRPYYDVMTGLEQSTCLKLLLAAGAQVKFTDLSHIRFTSCGYFQITHPSNIDPRQKKSPIMMQGQSVLLLYAAGLKEFEEEELTEEYFEDQGEEVQQIYEYLDRKRRIKHDDSFILSEAPMLLEMCREVIRDSLIERNTNNLFKLVPMLPLPHGFKSYLLFGVTLEVDIQVKDQGMSGFATGVPTYSSGAHRSMQCDMVPDEEWAMDELLPDSSTESEYDSNTESCSDMDTI